MSSKFYQSRHFSFFILITAMIYLFFLVAPGFSEGFFLVDDSGLFYQMYHRNPWSWQSLLTIWTPGNSADYYPIKDMSVWLDWTFSSNLLTDTTAAKIQNIFWLFGSTIFLYLLLKLWTKDRLFSAIISAAWCLHPFHLESVHWISARKDLMSWFFTIGSGYFFSKYIDTPKRSFALLTCIFFVFGMLSKAGFLALPFALTFWFGFEHFKYKRKIDKGTWGILAFGITASFVLVGVNYWNYTHSNFMRMSEEPTIRFLSVLTAFGRNVIGSLVPVNNAIDVEPWGGWYIFHKSFILVGAVSLIIILSVGFWSYFKEQRKIFLSFLLIVSVLLMTPGFNPAHRNYYSIRYFEPIFFLVFVTVSIQFFVTKGRFKYALASLFIFAGGLTWDAKNWESNFLMMQKSYALAPQDPSLRTMLLYEYHNLDTWGRLTPYQIKDYEDMYRIQKEECLDSPSPSQRCLSFYPKIGNFLQRFPVSESEKDSIRSKALKDSVNMKGQLFSAVAPAEMAWSRFHYNLHAGLIDISSLSEYFKVHKTFTDDFTRVRYIVYKCFSESSDVSRNLTLQWENSMVLDRAEVYELINDIKNERLRENVKSCFWLESR